MSQAQMTTNLDKDRGGGSHNLRNTLLAMVVVTVVAAGGWWAYQSGMLSGLPGQPAQTTQAGQGTGSNANGATGQTRQSWRNRQNGQIGQAAQAGQAGQTGQTGQSDQTGQSAQVMPLGAPPAGAPPAGAPPFGAPSAAGQDASTANAAAMPAQAGQAGQAASAGKAAQAATAAQVAAAPAATPQTPLAALLMLSGVDGATVYADDGKAVATLEAGTTLTATARSTDSQWLAVQTDTGSGWAKSDALIGYGMQQLAVKDAPQAAVTAANAAAAAATAQAQLSAAAQPAQAAPATAAGSGDGTTLKLHAVAPAPEAGTAAALAQAAQNTQAAGAAALLAKVISTDSRLNVRSGPGASYAVVAKANPGDSFAAVGRNADTTWLQVKLSDGSLGWASAQYLEVNGDASALPVSQAAASAQAAPVSLSSTEVAAPAAASTSSAAGATANSGSATVTPVKAAALAAATAGAATGLQGTLVFQQSPGGTIYAYNLQTGALKPLTNGFDPAISPDGKTVAFVRDGGENGLYLINIDGPNERKIFSERVKLASPKWSTDGKSILFSRNDEYVECYQMGPQCIPVDAFNKRFPNGAPFSAPLVKEYTHQLSVVDANGNNFHDVPALTSAVAPDWNSAGIVYSSKAGLQITQDTSGTKSKELAFDELKPFYVDPDWQPGGGQIAFQVKGTNQWDIYLINADGTGMHPVTHPATALVDVLPSNVAPAYSPDGKHIVFLSNRTASNDAGDYHLWVMDADGSNQRQLPIDMAITYSFGQDQTVDWGI